MEPSLNGVIPIKCKNRQVHYRMQFEWGLIQNSAIASKILSCFELIRTKIMVHICWHFIIFNILEKSEQFKSEAHTTVERVVNLPMGRSRLGHTHPSSLLAAHLATVFSTLSS